MAKHETGDAERKLDAARAKLTEAIVLLGKFEMTAARLACDLKAVRADVYQARECVEAWQNAVIRASLRQDEARKAVEAAGAIELKARGLSTEETMGKS